ncbi:MAG: adenosylcobinamide-GDP ribazoletransferase [Pseudomonadota bacterium]
MKSVLEAEVASFLLAVQFLTRLPVPTANLYTSERMAASVRYYPFVGILVGGVSALVFISSLSLFPFIIALLFSIATGLILTGAFHEDGLADTFDGIGGGLTRQKALEIMKDSRLGTYGTVAIVVALALKVAALFSLAPDTVMASLIAGHCLSRLSSVLVIATSRYVRDEGTGKPVAGGISAASLFIAVASGALVLVGWCFIQPLMALVWSFMGLLAGHILMRLFFEPKLGGYTGDTLGAVQQASEIGFYLGLAAWH